MQVLLRSLAPPAAAPGLDDKLNSGSTECHRTVEVISGAFLPLINMWEPGSPEIRGTP